MVVSIAASVPNLQELVLDKISRSAVHAPELIGAYPFVPVVSGDEDILFRIEPRLIVCMKESFALSQYCSEPNSMRLLAKVM